MNRERSRQAAKAVSIPPRCELHLYAAVELSRKSEKLLKEGLSVGGSGLPLAR